MSAWHYKGAFTQRATRATLRAARRAFSSTSAYKDFSQRPAERAVTDGTALDRSQSRVEPVSTLGAVESGSVRHRALCERNIRNPCFRLWLAARRAARRVTARYVNAA